MSIWGRKITAGVVTAFCVGTMAYYSGILAAISVITLCGLWYFTGIEAQREKHVRDLKDIRDMVKGFRK